MKAIKILFLVVLAFVAIPVGIVYSFGGNVQEIIMLDGDKSSERSAILSNINTYYSIY